MPPQGRIVTKVATQPDGATIAVVENWDRLPEEGSVAYIERMLPSGAADPSFAGGSLSFACAPGSAMCAPRVSVDKQGRIWIASGVASTEYPYPIEMLEIRRFLAGGAPDTTFGAGGTLRLRSAEFCPGGTCGYRLFMLASITTFQNGRALLAVDCLSGSSYDVDGTCALSLGNTGTLDWVRPFPRFMPSFAQSAVAAFPDGSAILGGRVDIGDANAAVPRAALLKILADGRADLEFHGGAPLVFPGDGAKVASQVAAMRDGSVVVLLSDNFGVYPTNGFNRVTAKGAIDGAWGTNAARAPQFTPVAFTIDEVDRVVAVGTVASQATVTRLLADGRVDMKFAGQGIASLPFKGGSQGRSVAVRADGRIVAGGTSYTGFIMVPAPKPSFPPHPEPVPAPLVFQLQGGEAATEFNWRTLTAVEYYHAQFNHFFTTINGDEMQALDLADNASWVRTGEQFDVFYPYSTGISIVCRFWSGQSFAPKSSHFYTPYASEECSPLKSSTVWTYEGDVFSLKLPDGPPGEKTCPAGMRPLYRAYNNGQGGAPNHRYTTDTAVLDTMVAQGWVMEGDGVTRVFACSAAQ